MLNAMVNSSICGTKRGRRHFIMQRSVDIGLSFSCYFNMARRLTPKMVNLALPRQGGRLSIYENWVAFWRLSLTTLHMRYSAAMSNGPSGSSSDFQTFVEPVTLTGLLLRYLPINLGIRKLRACLSRILQSRNKCCGITRATIGTDAGNAMTSKVWLACRQAAGSTTAVCWRDLDEAYTLASHRFSADTCSRGAAHRRRRFRQSRPRCRPDRVRSNAIQPFFGDGPDQIVRGFLPGIGPCRWYFSDGGRGRLLAAGFAGTHRGPSTAPDNGDISRCLSGGCGEFVCIYFRASGRHRTPNWDLSRAGHLHCQASVRTLNRSSLGLSPGGSSHQDRRTRWFCRLLQR